MSEAYDDTYLKFRVRYYAASLCQHEELQSLQELEFVGAP